VAFQIGRSVQCNAVLNGGSGQCTSTAAPAGTDRVTASYSGAQRFAKSTATTTVSVAKSVPDIHVTQTPPRQPVRSGASIAVRVRLGGSPSPPSGNVLISHARKRLCTMKSLGTKARSCRITTKSLGGRGRHRLTITYRGDARHEATVRYLVVHVRA
jgi:hypothetical protein